MFEKRGAGGPAKGLAPAYFFLSRALVLLIMYTSRLGSLVKDTDDWAAFKLWTSKDRIYDTIIMTKINNSDVHIFRFSDVTWPTGIESPR